MSTLVIYSAYFRIMFREVEKSINMKTVQQALSDIFMVLLASNLSATGHVCIAMLQKSNRPCNLMCTHAPGTLIGLPHTWLGSWMDLGLPHTSQRDPMEPSLPKPSCGRTWQAPVAAAVEGGKRWCWTGAGSFLLRTICSRLGVADGESAFTVVDGCAGVVLRSVGVASALAAAEVTLATDAHAAAISPAVVTPAAPVCVGGGAGEAGACAAGGGGFWNCLIARTPVTQRVSIWPNSRFDFQSMIARLEPAHITHTMIAMVACLGKPRKEKKNYVGRGSFPYIN
eukprot:909377-Pelagomonas_calceolata.AAC.1